MTDHVCPPDHKHGIDSVCYLHHGCRDLACRSAHTRRMGDRRKQIAYGRYTRGRVDAGPVRDHIAALRSHGLGVRYIAAAAGVGRATVASIMWGQPRPDGTRYARTKCAATTAARILAVQPNLDHFADHARIDATSTHRRLHALAAIGWSYVAVGRVIGVSDRGVSRLSREPRVSAGMARRVRDAYEQLWSLQPPVKTPQQREMVRRTIARAHANGWAPPLGWDDIETDAAPSTPDREPADIDVIAIELATNGHPVHLTTAERHEVVRVLNARGHDDTFIAACTGYHPDHVGRVRKKLGIPAAVGPDRERIAS